MHCRSRCRLHVLVRLRIALSVPFLDFPERAFLFDDVLSFVCSESAPLCMCPLFVMVLCACHVLCFVLSLVNRIACPFFPSADLLAPFRCCFVPCAAAACCFTTSCHVKSHLRHNVVLMTDL